MHFHDQRRAIATQRLAHPLQNLQFMSLDVHHHQIWWTMAEITGEGINRHTFDFSR